jgi:hypothetical protein
MVEQIKEKIGTVLECDSEEINTVKRVAHRDTTKSSYKNCMFAKCIFASLLERRMNNT